MNEVYQRNEVFVLHRDDKTYRASIYWARASLEKLVSLKEDFLHSTELAQLADYRFPKRQLSYLLGRYAGKGALLPLLHNSHATEISIEMGVFHQPVVCSAETNNLGLSLSHCENYGIAVAYPEHHPLGIDLEALSKDRSPVIISQLTEHELAINQEFNGDRVEIMLALWTAKEALGKVLRCGLMVPLSVLEVNTLSRDGDSIVSTFTHFAQYKAISFLMGNMMCSLVLPKESSLQWNLAHLCEI